MAQIIFSYREVAEALIKQHGLHEGIWGIHMRFGINATNMTGADGSVAPAAVVPVVELGLQRFPEEGPLAVDAAKVNPREDAAAGEDWPQSLPLAMDN